MPLVRETNSGAKTILAHFHYCCNGQKPFAASFDWTSPKLGRMAHLDSEQTEFMMRYRDRILKKCKKKKEAYSSSSALLSFYLVSEKKGNDLPSSSIIVPIHLPLSYLSALSSFLSFS